MPLLWNKNKIIYTQKKQNWIIFFSIFVYKNYNSQNLHLLFTPFFPFRSFLYCSFSLLISPWSTSQTSAVGERSSLSTCSILLKEKKSAVGNASCWQYTIKALYNHNKNVLVACTQNTFKGAVSVLIFTTQTLYVHVIGF